MVSKNDVQKRRALHSRSPERDKRTVAGPVSPLRGAPLRYNTMCLDDSSVDCRNMPLQTCRTWDSAYKLCPHTSEDSWDERLEAGEEWSEAESADEEPQDA